MAQRSLGLGGGRGSLGLALGDVDGLDGGRLGVLLLLLLLLGRGGILGRGLLLLDDLLGGVVLGVLGLLGGLALAGGGGVLLLGLDVGGVGWSGGW